MTVTTTAHKNLLDLKAEQIYRNKSVRVCLSTAALNANSSNEDIFASELLPVYGYSRINSTFGNDAGTYNAQSLSFALPQIQATFTANGGVVQWQSAFVLIGGSAIASKSFTEANVNPATDRIEMRQHGLTNGDRLVFTAETTGVLPGDINSTTRYYVGVIDSLTVELYTDAALTTKVDITSTGSGTMYARYASGAVAAVVQESAVVQLLDGQSYSYLINLKESI